MIYNSDLLLFQIKNMSMFLLDLVLSDIAYVHFYSSILAASAIYVSRELLGCDKLWDKSFVHYTKYSENDLTDCVRVLKKAISKLSKSKFVVRNWLFVLCRLPLLAPMLNSKLPKLRL